MTELAETQTETLELIRRICSDADADLTPGDLLRRICESILESLVFERISAVQYHRQDEELSELADAGVPATTSVERQAIASIPLLAEALQAERLVLASDGRAGELAWVFAVPLIRGERCLGFLTGERRAVPLDQGEVDVLVTVSTVVAALLESTLAREEAQRLSALKSEFIALAAHELRNSVSTIYGVCITMDERGDALDERDLAALRAVLREQALQMRTLIEQLLDLSRFDLAALQVAPEPVRLRPRIEELARAAAGAHPEAVTVAVAEDLEAVLDPTALDRMLSNLVANAFRHGEPPVTVTAARCDTHLRLAVEDRGEGVRREFIPRLFDRFARSPEARDRTDGSGLGLAIARTYARAHGGDIFYEPVVPHGARFEVVLPVRIRERTGLRN
jgi:signal transduction histidine kinase